MRSVRASYLMSTLQVPGSARRFTTVSQASYLPVIQIADFSKQDASPTAANLCSLKGATIARKMIVELVHSARYGWHVHTDTHTHTHTYVCARVDVLRMYERDPTSANHWTSSIATCRLGGSRTTSMQGKQRARSVEIRGSTCGMM